MGQKVAKTWHSTAFGSTAAVLSVLDFNYLFAHLFSALGSQGQVYILHPHVVAVKASSGKQSSQAVFALNAQRQGEVERVMVCATSPETLGKTQDRRGGTSSLGQIP